MKQGLSQELSARDFIWDFFSPSPVLFPFFLRKALIDTGIWFHLDAGCFLLSLPSVPPLSLFEPKRLTEGPLFNREKVVARWWMV